jgi:two-component system, chemotaxis family, protein-glutamate methylesterase/glutaminase
VLNKIQENIKSSDDIINRVNILIVDDSIIARNFITRWLADEPGICVAAAASNGESALAMLRTNQIDVVILDIEMPGMNGIEALPKMLELNSHVQIIMASTLTLHNAEISLRALEIGAVDYITKPRSSLSKDTGVSFRDELIAKVKYFGERARRLRHSTEIKSDVSYARKPPLASNQLTLSLRKMSDIKPMVLAIGASTGGPQALFTLLAKLNLHLPVPIVITQHMPATFTSILAQHIERLTGFICREAEPNMPIEPGRAYVAPGDRHLEFFEGAPMRASVTLLIPCSSPWLGYMAARY